MIHTHVRVNARVKEEKDAWHGVAHEKSQQTRYTARVNYCGKGGGTWVHRTYPAGGGGPKLVPSVGYMYICVYISAATFICAYTYLYNKTIVLYQTNMIFIMYLYIYMYIFNKVIIKE